ncbi:MAG TPA: CPBP family glutamic-type intramembrane protease [Gemmataceae bacterium]|jgi:tetratricopeptide (TPR) repeat protein/membrane protease YdiL (CAAX protease family)
MTPPDPLPPDPAPDPPTAAGPDDIPFVLPVDDIPVVLPAPPAVAPPRGGLGTALGLGLLLLFMEVVIAIPFGVVGGIFDVWRESWFQCLVQAIASVAAAVVVARRADFGDVRRAVAFRGCRPVQLVLAVLLAPALVPLADAAFALVTRGLGWEPVAAARPPFFQKLDNFYVQLARLPWPLAVLCGCLAPAVSEELFFRGTVGRRLLARYGPVAGVLLTTLLFALAHVDPARVAATFVLGLALHGVYLATRSLLPGMALHAVYNLLVIGGTKANEAGGWDVSGQTAAPAVYGLLLAVSAAAVVVIGLALWRARTRWELPDGSIWSPGYVTAEQPPDWLEAVPRSVGPGAGRLAAVAAACLGLAAAAGLAVEQPAEWKAYRLRVRGDELLEAGDLDAALADYDESLRLKPDDDNRRQRGFVHRRRGDDRAQAGDADGAVRAYDAALADNPDDLYAAGNRGMAHAQTGNYAQALADLDRALAVGPGEAEWYVYRAGAHFALGHLDQALADYAAALKLRPADAFARHQRGRILFRREDWAGALAELDKAAAAGEDTPDLRADRGRALFRLHRYAAAAGELEAAVRQQPGHWTATYDLTWLLAACPDAARRDGPRAATLARRFCEATEWAAPNWLAALAAAEAECGHFADAVRYQEDALKKLTAGDRAFHEKALALYRAGRPYRIGPDD